MTVQATLRCRLGTAPGALERVLRVIRVRGFETLGLEYARTPSGFELTIALQGTRQVAHLTRHLGNLNDVHDCRQIPTGDEVPGPGARATRPQMCTGA